MKRAHIIALVVIFAAIAFTAWAFVGNGATPYVDIKTARQLGTRCQIRGKILHPTVFWDMKQSVLRFRIEDKNRDQIDVVYHGAKPDSFDTAPETAMDGYIVRGPDGKEYIDSSSMVIKCPSKYNDVKSPYRKPVAGGGEA